MSCECCGPVSAVVFSWVIKANYRVWYLYWIWFYFLWTNSIVFVFDLERQSHIAQVWSPEQASTICWPIVGSVCKILFCPDLFGRLFCKQEDADAELGFAASWYEMCWLKKLPQSSQVWSVNFLESQNFQGFVFSVSILGDYLFCTNFMWR